MTETPQPFADVKPAVSDETKAKTAPPEPSKPRSRRFVRYTGAREEHASMRRIKAAAWRELGIKAERTHVWELGNDWRIPVSEFTDPQLDYLLDVDGRFEIINNDGQIVGR